jgi:mono/diheme cytochrome c family protein
MQRILCLAAFLCAVLFYLRTPSWAAEANSGQAFYLKYCASCHGMDGKGNGPVAKDLKVEVPDLTALKKNNKGVFPLARVISSIDGTRKVRGHGEATMPVWGEVFKEELKEKRYPELTRLLKTKAIAEYIGSIQR